MLSKVSQPAINAMLYLTSRCRTAVDKLDMCLVALDEICKGRALSADSVLSEFIKLVVVILKGSDEVPSEEIHFHADLKIIEEFCRDELLRGKEGYALAIFQSSLMFLDATPPEKLYGEVLCAQDEVMEEEK